MTGRYFVKRRFNLKAAIIIYFLFCGFLFSFASQQVFAQNTTQLLRAGAVQVDITPPIGCEMSGYAARKNVSQGMHDPLFAGILILDNGWTKIALITLDIIGVEDKLIAEVKLMINQKTGISIENIMLSATHTHSGPESDEIYDTMLKQKIIGGVLWAYSKLQFARIGSGKGHVTGIAINRRSLNGEPIDPDVGVILVEDLSGKLVTIWVNYTAHATAMSWNNLMISADYPGFMRQTVQKVYGNDVVVMFANGAEGDINAAMKDPAFALGLTPTQNTFGPLLDGIGELQPHRTFEHCGRIGTILGGEVIKVVENISMIDNVSLKSTSKIISLPVRKFESVQITQKVQDEADAKVKSLQASGADKETLMKSRVDAFLAMMRNWAAKRGERLKNTALFPAYIQVIRIGDAVFAGWPGEFFSGIGRNVKNRSGLEKTFIVGLANGSVGYLPTKDAYEEKGYEIDSTIFSENAVDILSDETLKLIGEVK